MGLFNLYRFYLAFIIVSLVVSPVFSQNRWPVSKPDVSVGYYSLDKNTLPLRSSPAANDVFYINKATTSNSSYIIPKGGEQAIFQRGTVAANDSHSVLKGRFKWSNVQVSNALKKAWRLGKITPHSILANAIADIAIQRGMDWHMGEDGQIYYNSDGGTVYLNSNNSSYFCYPSFNVSEGTCYTSPDEFCQLGKGINDPPFGTTKFTGDYRLSPFGGEDRLECAYNSPENPTRVVWTVGRTAINNGSCPVGYLSDKFGCYQDSVAGELVSEEDIFDFVDTVEAVDYNPVQFDEVIKTSELDSPEEFFIDSIDPIKGVVEETLTTNQLTGEQTLVKESTDYDFSIENVNGNPSVVGTTSQNSSTYKNGELVNSSVISSSSRPFVGDNPAPVPNEVTLDIQECSDFPESCAYYDYMKQPFSPPDNFEVDFDGIDMGDIDLSSSFQYDFDLGVSASCPSPMVIDLGSFGSPTISYEPLCEVAEDTRPFVLTSAIIFSIMILLGSARKV